VAFRAIAETLGYKHCTSVQAESLGPLLSGADMVVKAKTGTGKTLAFLIPGIEQVRRPCLLIIEPYVPCCLQWSCECNKGTVEAHCLGHTVSMRATQRHIGMLQLHICVAC